MKLNWFESHLVAGCSAAAGLAACSDDNVERFAGVVSYDDFPANAAGADRSDDLGVAHAFVLSAGFANGSAVQYLDLGEFNPTPAKVYILTKGGAPIAGQFPIVDTLPDDAEYSPFWQIVEVAVTGSYKANDVKSLKGIEDAGWKQTATLEALHCPIVNPDATWFAADLGATFLVFWGTGEEIPNPYFDPSAATDDVNKPTLNDTDATASDIVLTPLWQKRMRGFCWSDDLARRYPLVDDAGSVSLDLDGAGNRFDTYGVAFGPGGELGAEPTNLLPVFDHNLGDADYNPIVFQSFVASLDGSQPGSVADFDPEEVASVEPSALLDNPIVFPLALERFRVTITNTTPAAGTAGSLDLGAGFATVEDGSAPLYFDGESAPSALAEFAASGDVSALVIGWPVSGRPLSPTLDSQVVPAVAPGESVSFVVLGAPFVPLFTLVQKIVGLDNGFTGVSELPLYDADLGAIATQSLELTALITNAEAANPEPPPDTLEVVGPAPDLTDSIGTLEIELIVPAGGTP